LSAARGIVTSAGVIILPVLMLAAAVTANAGVPSVAPAVIDRIVVDKAEHRMTLTRGGKVVRIYQVALGKGGLAPKVAEGDNQVPEGIYRVTGRKADSQFHKALRIGYPTPRQASAARARGVDPGSNIMIHGLPNGLGWIGSWHRLRDWTAGCVAVTDAEIDQIWKLVPVGTIVEIRGRARQESPAR
jgi:murein L,D-transpeptidase YafK